MQRPSEISSSRRLRALSDALSSMSDGAKRWRSLSETAPAMLIFSLIVFLVLGYFSLLNVAAILAGMIAGGAGVLGHLGLVTQSQRAQIFSVFLVVISVFMLPSAGGFDGGLLMLNGFSAGMGLAAIILLVISKIVKRTKSTEEERLE
ncbi:MAG: hypothetical protein AB7V39_29140 [Nitrospiraceae bacterium]